jgi:hypothetical protein
MKKIILLSLTFISLWITGFAQTPKEQVRMVLEDVEFSFEQGDTKHILYNYSNLSDNQSLIIALTSNTTYDCHACGAFVSVFLFGEDGFLAREFIKITEVGSFGTPPVKEDIEVFPTQDKFMLIVKGGFSNMGSSEDFIQCFYVLDEQLKLVADNIPVFYDNSGIYEKGESGYRHWKGTYTFMLKENDLPEIVVDITGIKGIEDFSETKYYYFNGQKYVEKD